MLTHPEIDPVALALGPLKVHWYGLMYLVGFTGFWLLGRWRSRQSWSPVNAEQVGDFLFYGAMGAVLGGRIGYILFYDFPGFLADPLKLVRVWEGGMSFHGGMLGVFVAILLYARKLKVHFFTLSDFIAPLVPIGLGAGRMGNFINGELWGRPTDAPWGMVFPQVDTLARHPSQLYQAFLEGVVLFLVLWVVSRKARRTGLISGLFLIGYGMTRIIVEFFRQPDAHLQFVAFDWVTMGQVLSLPMIFAGLIIIAWSRRQAVAGTSS